MKLWQILVHAAVDLRTYPNSLMADIHRRLDELSKAEVQREVYRMVADGVLGNTAGKTYRRYFLLP